MANTTSGSHPAIRFEHVPVTEGALFNLDALRPRLLGEAINKTKSELVGVNLDLLLGEALYSERVRLKRDRGTIFTHWRLKRDRALWSGIQEGLLKPSVQADRAVLLENLLKHYAEEIGGHFNQGIYKLATHAIPFGFNWLLNAASVKRFLPWKMTESLESRFRIQGDVSLVQRLAKRGTILMVPTHQSNIDSVIIGYVICLMSLPPFSYGAGLNLFSNPLLSFFMGRLGAYTVDRRKTNEIYKRILKNYSAGILSEGIHSIFFPGGGRSRSGAIESKIKLGLLGTGLEAQIKGLRSGKQKASVFVVPMVTSYHFVLEAATLIEDYLVEAGKHRFIITDDEFWQPLKVFNFFWKLFASQTAITVRIGRPLDVFGNFVDEDGRSLGPNGTTVDPVKWLTTKGEVREEPSRDREYTRQLGLTLSDRFHMENTVLSSHLVAFAFFETLRGKYPELDLYRFLRLSLPQRSMTEAEFLSGAEIFHRKLKDASSRGELFLSPELNTDDVRSWVDDGLKQLGLVHATAVVKMAEGAAWTEDMSLLYYYRNRLSGYGLSILAEPEGLKTLAGRHDSKGFLA